MIFGEIEARGLTISLAYDGIAGLRAILRRNADLALVEVDLPQLNGINLAKIIELLEFKTPLIFIAESDQYRERSMSLGNAVDFILHAEIKARFNYQLLTKHQAQTASAFELPFTLDVGEWHNLFTTPGRTPRVDHYTRI